VASRGGGYEHGCTKDVQPQTDLKRLANRISSEAFAYDLILCLCTKIANLRAQADKLLKFADLWLSRRGYGIQLMHGLQVWAMMDCKYGLWIQGLWPVPRDLKHSARKSYVNWMDLGPPSAAPLFFFLSFFEFGGPYAGNIWKTCPFWGELSTSDIITILNSQAMLAIQKSMQKNSKQAGGIQSCQPNVWAWQRR